MNSEPQPVNMLKRWFDDLDESTRAIVESAFFNGEIGLEQACAALNENQIRPLISKDGLIDLYLQAYNDKNLGAARKQTLATLAKDVTNYIGGLIDAQSE
jgi:hypothetical protein